LQAKHKKKKKNPVHNRPTRQVWMGPSLGELLVQFIIVQKQLKQIFWVAKPMSRPYPLRLVDGARPSGPGPGQICSSLMDSMLEISSSLASTVVPSMYMVR
jgi:hypothetical protein